MSMKRQDDQLYFTGRVRDEIDRGDQARNSSIAAIHYELAYRYSLLCAKARPGPRLSLVSENPKPVAARLFTNVGEAVGTRKWRSAQSVSAVSLR